MQLTNEQRVFFVVRSYYQTRSYAAVRERFRARFPERQPPPSKSTIERNVKKYERNFTSRNLNKGRSGRQKTIRTADNIQAVERALQINPRISARRNGLGLTKTTFNCITKKDLRWHPFKMLIRHKC